MSLYSNRRRPVEPRRGPKPQCQYEDDVDVVRPDVVHALDEDELEKLFMWVDEIPLSRPKRNMTRDFSDGVLAAEILKFKVKTVDLHNYPTCNNIQGKQDNWAMLNRKVLLRLNTELSPDVIQAICACKPNVIESVLCILRDKIDLYLADQQRQQNQRPAGRRAAAAVTADAQYHDMRPEADQENRVDYLNVQSESLDYLDSDSRGYIPSAEGFYQDGQFQQPPTRSPQGKNMHPPAPAQGNLSGRSGAKQEMLPKGLLDQREQAIMSREQSIQILTGKVQRLEQLLRLKDLRIEDLQDKLDKLTAPMNTQQRGMGGGRMARQPVARY